MADRELKDGRWICYYGRDGKQISEYFSKEVMDQIWKRFRPDKNVIRMDDYRE